MILLVNNNGPFSFNLKHLLLRLEQQVEMLNINDSTTEKLVSKEPEAVILTTGPHEDSAIKANVALVEECWHKGIPLLGIGLGMHALAMAFGAKLVPGINTIPGSEVEVIHDEVRIYEGLASPIKVGRFETRYVDEESLGDDLLITAHTLEGEIMGLRADRGILEGVQFNPESLITSRGTDIIENFMSLVREN